MKKLIAISVVFALVAGVAFAVDLSGTVHGHVNVIEASSASGSEVTGSAALTRIRIEGSGDVSDGQFGGWLRMGQNEMAGYVWWKPIDQLKVLIGNNGGDGFWGQEGITGWGFTPYGATDSGVVYTGDHVWGGGFNMRSAFFGGVGYNSLNIEITPVEMVAINIAIPFFNQIPTLKYNTLVEYADRSNRPIGDIFKGTVAQVALNLSFGSFAFTFAGPGEYATEWLPDAATGDYKENFKLDDNSKPYMDMKDSRVFGFFSLTAIENLEIDFGLGANFQNTPINLGLGVAYGRDTWGVKFRSTFAVPVRSEQNFGMLFDVLPYFVVNENFSVYVNAGMRFSNIDSLNSKDGNVADWHINPYIEVGGGWGPKFYAGIDVYTDALTGSPAVQFKLPIAIMVGF